MITLPLEGDLHHPQGLSPRASGRGDGWWVTTVDLAVPRGLVVGFDADGRRTDAIDVTDGDRIFSSSRTGNSAASRQKS